MKTIIIKITLLAALIIMALSLTGCGAGLGMVGTLAGGMAHLSHDTGLQGMVGGGLGSAASTIARSGLQMGQAKKDVNEAANQARNNASPVIDEARSATAETVTGKGTPVITKAPEVSVADKREFVQVKPQIGPHVQEAMIDPTDSQDQNIIAGK